jgi:hypothetical protein
MVIDCAQCEFRPLACGDCLVTVLPENESSNHSRKGREMDIQDVAAETRPGRHPLGARELRALNVLATAGMVPALRYRPAPISKLAGAIVALCSRARAVIGETGATLAEALETAKCFHYGLFPVTPSDFVPRANRCRQDPGGERT